MNPIPSPEDLKKPQSLDWPKAEAHLEKVETHLMSFAGKEDHNPYIAIKELKIDKMKASLRRKMYSDELYKAIMSLDANYIPKVEDLKSVVIQEVFIPENPEIKTHLERN